MSTIASPREPSINGRRVPLIPTPTSSARPSLEVPRSDSPNPNTGVLPRRNRAALREYYNLKNQKAAEYSIPDNLSEVSSIHDSSSDVLPSELDLESFDTRTYTRHVLESQSLAQLLKTYNGVLCDIRALDAEKKALVYNNYSKLIAATETIGRMREGMGSENGSGMKGVEGTLGTAVESVYERAQKLRDELRNGMPRERKRVLEMGVEERREIEKKERAGKVVRRVLQIPGKLGDLVREGRMDEARELWERKRIVLERWRERGVGGEEVGTIIEDGERALRGEAQVRRAES